MDAENFNFEDEFYMSQIYNVLCVCAARFPVEIEGLTDISVMDLIKYIENIRGWHLDIDKSYEK